MRFNSESTHVPCGCRSVGECDHRMFETLESLEMMVDAFAQEMKEKLRKKWMERQDGWDEPKKLSDGKLIELLMQQVGRADMDPIDVANFAAFIWNRRGKPQDKEKQNEEE